MNSLRWRLAAAFALVVSLVTTSVGLVVYDLSTRDLLDRTRRSALDQASAAAVEFAQLGVRPYQAAAPPYTAVPAPLRRVVEAGHAATFFTDAPSARVWAGELVPGRGPVFVRVAYTTDEAALSALARTLVLVGALSTLGGAALGFAIAARVSRRLARAAAVTDRVAAGELSARIPVRGKDEIDRLAAGVNRMAASLGERIAHERRFVADVAHDLRTPVTSLVTASGLLGPGQVEQAVRASAHRLRGLVEDLLEVARLDAGGEAADPRPVDLAAFVGTVVARYDQARIVTDGPALVSVDPRRLERILDNLLTNAERHGAPLLEVEVSATRIAVRDHGPGFPPGFAARAADRFATADAARAAGTGLGLAIAAGQARVLGAQLTIQNHPLGGAYVIITLPGPRQA